MATVYTREWIKFFTGCGIPDDVAAMYALIFYENRIQKNMLLDLNKEYLRDMGITVMGDVIAILRHAKIIHEKYIRAKILSVDDDVVTEQSISISDSSPELKKSTPMKRILEHYTRKYNSYDSESVNEVQVTLPSDKITISEKGEEKLRTQRPFKKKIQISSKEKDIKEEGLEVPVPKVRRVLPENEGGYKIKMPSGTTERSKKLLEQAKKRKAKTVFDRLGESSVSSTTSEISTNTVSSSLNKEKNPSVFSRLGEKASVVSSTSSVEDSETLLPDHLPYAGILKAGTPKKNLSNRATMRADEQQQSELNKVIKGVSVKKRLGLSTSEEVTKRPVLKAVRRTGETKTKTTVMKLSNKFNSSPLRAKSDAEEISGKNFKVDNSETTLPDAPIQTQKTRMLTLKRKINSDIDASPLKKVRFGRTTHRLIPASPNPSDPVSYVKNYPKLTMIISNRAKVEENNTLSSGIKIGSLNSDTAGSKLGVKARIGNKSVQRRLGKQMANSNHGNSRVSQKSTVKDRLG